jgi:two-component system LytT family response regulator
MASIRSKDGILTVKRSGEVRHWELADILWLEASDHHTRLCLARGEEVIRANLVSFEHWLPRSQFRRISRSVIVNRRRVRAVKEKLRGDFEVTMDDGSRLAGSRNCRARFHNGA